MMQQPELVIIGLSCVILIPFIITWLFVRRANKRIDQEQEELLENQLYARCSCGFREIYDKREKTLTECPDCGLKVQEPQI
jgi:DNA-directed RNA polymerase subunit RPC12/RpoP